MLFAEPLEATGKNGISQTTHLLSPLHETMQLLDVLRGLRAALRCAGPDAGFPWGSLHNHDRVNTLPTPNR